ncbi:MAG: hypothetical protein B6D34_08495 [Candidatus Brocadia sp. UTAMX1]|nr:MAG: hypothetical protein B6D34_08495 [Candidatus Brocadia sp. UTAMX1]
MDWMSGCRSKIHGQLLYLFDARTHLCLICGIGADRRTVLRLKAAMPVAFAQVDFQYVSIEIKPVATP